MVHSASLCTVEFIAPRWRADFQRSGLTSLQHFWNLPGEEVEPPNFARGGWSRVLRCQLSSGKRAMMYVKRQVHYQTKSWRHPLRGEPTLQREFRNLEHCHRYGVPTAPVIYFASFTMEGGPAAILVTEALVDFEALDVHLGKLGPDNKPMRQEVLRAVARLLARLHGSGLKHCCFYPKHILVPTDPAKVEDLRFIDLEKARCFLVRRAALRRDLQTLFCRLPMCSAEEQDFFVQAYQEAPATDRPRWW